MTQEIVADTVEERVDQCQHHWLIDVAGGPSSSGVCRLCGAERQFKNYLENAPWDDDAPAVRDSARAAISSVIIGDHFDDEG